MELKMSRLVSQLILEEGLRLIAYDDATSMPVPPGGVCKGNLTIGVGRNLDAKPLTQEECAAVGHDARLLPITHDNAIMLLDNDIESTKRNLTGYISWWAMLDEIRARVMVDLTFNMGIHKLLYFTKFLTDMRINHYDDAAKELENSLWYKQVHQRGQRLATMVRTGLDYTS